MKLSEYLNQTTPTRFPKVYLNQKEYSLGTRMKVGNDFLTQVFITDEAFIEAFKGMTNEYVMKNDSNVLYSQREGSPVSQSVFRLQSRMTIKQFKETFRFLCTDVWGNAMEAWFESVGQMYVRGFDIPAKYEYSSGLSPTDKESQFHETFKYCDDIDLIEIAEYLFRYCSYLKHKGVNY